MKQKDPLAICRRCYNEFDGFCSVKKSDVDDNGTCDKYERKNKNDIIHDEWCETCCEICEDCREFHRDWIGGGGGWCRRNNNERKREYDKCKDYFPKCGYNCHRVNRG